MNPEQTVGKRITCDFVIVDYVCVQMLVYEFMPNGSLHDLLSGTSSILPLPMVSFDFLLLKASTTILLFSLFFFRLEERMFYFLPKKEGERYIPLVVCLRR